MTKPLDVFFEMPCLTEKSAHLSGFALQKKWFKAADKRVIGQYLQKFIDYNKSHLEFLGVQPFLIGIDQNISLAFRSSEFIGTIPLRAPDTGKQIGDFVVSPRFIGRDRFEDYIEILDLLGSDISPKVIDSLPLASGTNFKPPLYLEAIKFLGLLEFLLMKSWRKFDSVENELDTPSGHVNWNKFFTQSYKIESRSKYLVRKNILSEYHNEYSEIRYVFDVCKIELLSSNSPQRIKNELRAKLSFVEEKLYLHKPKRTNNILIRSSDSPTIKNCKEQANKILNFNLVDSTAWRVDFSNVFEKFVQYIFKEVAKEIGGRLYPNLKFYSNSVKHYSWELKHIEPDAVYQKDDFIVVVDAKYKSNLYNKFDDSEFLKEQHRHDLHQIMAYSSFSDINSRHAVLCYPANDLEIKQTIYKSPINSAILTVLICGIPLKKQVVKDAKIYLASKLNAIKND